MLADLNKYKSKAIEAAVEAGKMLADGFGKITDADYKGDVDLVTDMDRKSERLIKKILTEAFDNTYFFGEEEGGDNWKKDLVWVVDPLDGTTNYANKIEQFCVSIALCNNGEPVVGVIYDPMRKNIYHCCKGGGAFFNDEPMSVNSKSDIQQALVVTGFPYNRRKIAKKLLCGIEAMMMNVQGIRRMGAAALDLCYVARGSFAVFWELNLKPWDIAAGSLLVQEAGGKVTRFDGSPMQLDSYQLLVTNSLVHDKAVEILKGCGL